MSKKKIVFLWSMDFNNFPAVLYASKVKTEVSMELITDELVNERSYQRSKYRYQCQ